jgi:transmembrane sensor
MAACAVAIAVIVLPALKPQPAPQYATRLAQIEPIRLQDGSVVTLGASSSIDANFADASKRQVTLRSGQAFFEVAHNAERPFFVQAGDVSIRVVGTKFDVRRGPEETIVSVREGVVRVSADGGAVQTLHAGDQAIVEHRTLLFLTRSIATQIASVQPENVASWRTGRLAYNDAPLSEVIADINRYYAPGVEVEPPDAAGVRITASFRTNEIDAFLDDLSREFPVSAARGPDGHYRIEATARAH